METTLGILIAIGLAAACGFRIFVPPLVAGVAHMVGWIDLAAGMEWIGSPVAVTCFAVATCVEIMAYFIPAVNNALDVISTPVAVVAGTVVAAGALVDLSPFVQWTLAAIMAATVTGSIQVASASGRAAATATTAGAGNPVFSLVETIGSIVTAVLAVLVPVVAVILVALLLGAAGWVLIRVRRLLRARAKRA
jgi:hypothetical protein